MKESNDTYIFEDHVAFSAEECAINVMLRRAMEMHLGQFGCDVAGRQSAVKNYLSVIDSALTLQEEHERVATSLNSRSEVFKDRLFGSRNVQD